MQILFIEICNDRRVEVKDAYRALGAVDGDG
jgi:hypothetical protein